MDALAALLHEVRSEGALFSRSILTPPWSIRFADGIPLTLLTMLRGSAWIRPDDADPVPLGPGQVAIVVGTTPYSVADDAHSTVAPMYVVTGPESCTGADGSPFDAGLHLGGRTYGERLDGPVALLTGSFQVRGRVSGRLLSALPRVLVVPSTGAIDPIMDLTGTEIDRDEPGQQAVLDRLLDLLLLTTLREWFARPDACAPAWYSALGDPVVGPVLRRVHADPARPWTVPTLAAEVGVSRATLARRFTELLGESPMAYLTRWRLSLASDLLARSDATVDSVARQVGYRSAFGLSVAFKREYGTRPSEHRTPAPEHVPARV